MQKKQFKLIVGGPQLFKISCNFILFLYLQIEIILLFCLVVVQIQNLFYFNKKAINFDVLQHVTYR